MFCNVFSHANYNTLLKACGNQGWLATWITNEHLKNFIELEKWTQRTIEMLESNDKSLIIYVDEHFWNNICDVNKTNVTYPLKSYFKSGLNNGIQEVVDRLETQIISDVDHPWWKVFEEELKKYPDIKPEELPF